MDALTLGCFIGTYINAPTCAGRTGPVSSLPDASVGGNLPSVCTCEHRGKCLQYLLCGRDAAAALNHHITTPLRKCFLDKIVSGNGDLSIELLNEILAEADREIEKSIPANQSERDRNPPPWSPKPVPPDLSVHSEPVTAYTDPPKEKEVPKTVDDGNQDGCCRCCCSTSNYAKVKDEKNKTSGKKDCCCCCEVA